MLHIPRMIPLNLAPAFQQSQGQLRPPSIIFAPTILRLRATIVPRREAYFKVDSPATTETEAFSDTGATVGGAFDSSSSGAEDEEDGGAPAPTDEEDAGAPAADEEDAGAPAPTDEEDAGAPAADEEDAGAPAADEEDAGAPLLMLMLKLLLILSLISA